MMIMPVMTSCHSVGEAQPAQAVGQELQDQHAERHAEQAADAAGQADAAEHRRGDHLELEVEAGRVLRRADAGGQDDAGDVASSELIRKQMNLTRRTS